MPRVPTPGRMSGGGNTGSAVVIEFSGTNVVRLTGNLVGEYGYDSRTEGRLFTSWSWLTVMSWRPILRMFPHQRQYAYLTRMYLQAFDPYVGIIFRFASTQRCYERQKGGVLENTPLAVGPFLLASSPSGSKLSERSPCYDSSHYNGISLSSR